MDLLTWFYMTDATKHLETSDGMPLYSQCWPPDSYGHGKIWWVKNGSGYPWDAMPYDDNLIYLQVTETADTWTDPKSYKSFAPPVPFCDRRIVTGLPAIPHSTSCAPYTIYKECEPVGNPNLGAVRTSVSGPWSLDHGADVGVQPTVVIAYQWGGGNRVNGFPTREQFYLVEGLGLVRWDTASLDRTAGMYVVGQASVFNRIVAGGCPTILFPCNS